MYKYKQVRDNMYVLSLDNHVEVSAAIAAFCAEKGILAGNIVGLGAVSEATFRFLDPNTLKYVDKTFTEQMEITIPPTSTAPASSTWKPSPASSWVATQTPPRGLTCTSSKEALCPAPTGYFRQLWRRSVLSVAQVSGVNGAGPWCDWYGGWLLSR